MVKNKKEKTSLLTAPINQRRGQLKIQQMAFMLIVVTLFFVLVGLFMLSFGLSGLKKSATGLAEENSLLLVSKLANSPEFSCGNSFDNPGSNCVDEDKVMALKNNPKYENFWGDGVSSIEIERVYPASTGKVCNEGNYPNCEIIRLLSNTSQGYYNENFVSLCRKSSGTGGVYDNCNMAKLRVGYKEVQ